MVFTQISYLHKQGLQDQNKGFTNCAEFTLQWRNYPIWRYSVKAFGDHKKVTAFTALYLRQYLINDVEKNNYLKFKI